MRLAIIPARSGSSRIPDKNVIDFCGKPMLAYPIAAAQDSGLFDTIHVSTDSARYADIARDLGSEVDFLRAPDIARNHVPVTEVLRWVVEEYAARGRVFDEFCLVMATAPLIEAADLLGGHALFLDHGREIPVLSVVPFASPVERGMRIGADGVLAPMFPEKRHLHSQDLAPVYHDAGVFFFISARQLMEDRVEVYNRLLPYVIPIHKAVDIDEPDDLAFAEALYLGRQVRASQQ